MINPDKFANICWQIKHYPSITTLNLEDEFIHPGQAEDIHRTLVASGHKNLVEVNAQWDHDSDPQTQKHWQEKIKHFCNENAHTAYALARKLYNNKPYSLDYNQTSFSAQEISEMKDRIPAIDYMLDVHLNLSNEEINEVHTQMNALLKEHAKQAPASAGLVDKKYQGKRVSSAEAEAAKMTEFGYNY